MAAKEIMCAEDFDRIFNVRLAEKCCANCKHSKCEYEGCATCFNPKRNDGGYIYTKKEIRRKNTIHTMLTSVMCATCGKLKEARSERADTWKVVKV